MEEQTKIYERLRDYINEHGIKQSYISDKTGIAPNTLNMLLNGKVKLDVDRLYLIMKKLDIEPNKLFY